MIWLALFISVPVLVFIYHMYSYLGSYRRINGAIDRIRSKVKQSLPARMTVEAIDSGEVKILPFQSIRRWDEVDDDMKGDDPEKYYDHLCENYHGFYRYWEDTCFINTNDDRTDQSIESTIVHEVKHHFNHNCDEEYSEGEDEVMARCYEDEYNGHYITRYRKRQIRAKYVEDPIDLDHH